MYESSTFFFCHQRLYTSYPFVPSFVHRILDLSISHALCVQHNNIHTVLVCKTSHVYNDTKRKRRRILSKKKKRKKRVFGVNREKIWPICLLYHYCKKVHLYFNFNCAKQNKTALKLSILSICVYCGEINQCVMVYESQTFHKNTISIE